MKINIKLLSHKKATAEGFPLIVLINHKNKSKQEQIGFAFPEHFLADEQVVSKRHPDYEVLAPIIADLKSRAKKLILQRVDDVDRAMAELFKIDFSKIGFLDFGQKLIAEMNEVALKLQKSGDLKAANKILGNIKVYENVMTQFENFGASVTLQDLDYAILMRFRNYQAGLGNKKRTLHLYLRTLRAIYNKGVLMHKLPDNKPFKGVFSGLSQKSYSSTKKHIDRESLRKFEDFNTKYFRQDKFVKLWLLQFYFGGCDLIDLYYLKKKQIRRGRVYFDRAKVDGPPIDLKIHPKAEAIIKEFETDGDWLFPWDKDRDYYEGFRRTMQRCLITVQEKLNIEVLPCGGNMGIKVARHTFANFGKQLMIHEDILRELMGHERNDVDNFYKDRYAQSVRDEALFKIIAGNNLSDQVI